MYKGYYHYTDRVETMEEALDLFYVPKHRRPFGAHLIWAEAYSSAYEGAAHVFYLHEGKLWEVSGAHCSCYGLEDQWEPEEGDVRAVLKYTFIPCDVKEDLRNLAELYDWPLA